MKNLAFLIGLFISGIILSYALKWMDFGNTKAKTRKEQADIIIEVIKAKGKVTINDFRSLINYYPEIMPALRAMANRDTQGIYELVKNNQLDVNNLLAMYSHT